MLFQAYAQYFPGSGNLVVLFLGRYKPTINFRSPQRFSLTSTVMRLSSGFLLASFALPWVAYAQSSSAAAYLATESPIAKAGLLANIGSSGSKASGAKAGVVVASPSKADPNYFFTWTRDSSLVFGAIIDQ